MGQEQRRETGERYSVKSEFLSGIILNSTHAPKRYALAHHCERGTAQSQELLGAPLALLIPALVAGRVRGENPQRYHNTALDLQTKVNLFLNPPSPLPHTPRSILGNKENNGRS